MADFRASWQDFIVPIAEKVAVCRSAHANHGCYNSGLRLPHTRQEERERKGRAPMAVMQEFQTERRCPWCNGSEIQLVQRGYTGPTDEVNQYYTCRACGKVTYELIAKTAREMRLGRYHAGGIYKDSVHQTRYSVSRVLKVGLNEYLIYLKPLPGSETFPVASINP
jgi:hypothetical protein